MLTPIGEVVLGTISIATTLFLTVFFLEKYLEERNSKKRTKYLILSIANILSLLFVSNVI
ncbi:hypothetical protein [Clostridium perfringens]|uniref:Uncharacterized protein n=2 Tax=Clostridium perfringens TaxID=1502 RepID=A0AAP7BVZ5_CLOPF|nr:hypothetical protein [Clostridium perfringens]NP_612857.1 Gp28 protein [Clostridium phage phi3626]AAL96798.1 Gp28 protein [Clostridium phage phi3626]EDT22895.1 conserved domain protein [Clostridium perfringens B str. ATCC 3626]NGU30635.1 hypothetical protein [Clostridium perfringens]WEV05048.1 hypothetical protein PL322_13855 [Clostridium perfringens B]